MKSIKLKQMKIENFKGCKENFITFGDRTIISGANATGKTTIVDAFMWLLFNKDSLGNTKFQVRPLDLDGNVVDNIEISVNAVITVDGEEVELQKVQKQNWVKRRGRSEKELQGNVNEFEIDGYPKTEKEYNAFISEIVDEDLFKTLTNPTTFTSRPWKEQRKVLMRLVGEDISDVEIAKGNEDTECLVAELEKASMDDVKAKYTKALNGLKKKQIEIPSRVDEVSKQMKDIDLETIEFERATIKNKISLSKAKLEDSSKQLSEYEQKTEEAMKLKFDVTRMKNDIENKLQEEKKIHSSELQRIKDEIFSGKSAIKLFEADIRSKQSLIEVNEDEKKKMQKLYSEIKDDEYNAYVPVPELKDGDFVCPTCGQQLQEDVIASKKASHDEREQANKRQYEKDKELFNKEKSERLAFIIQKGNNANDEIKKSKKSIIDRQESIQIKLASISKLEEELSKLSNKKFQSLEDALSENQEFQKLQQEVVKNEEYLESMQSVDANKKSLNAEIEALQNDLLQVEKELASANNDDIKKRIAELEEEQVDVNQRIADCEQMLYAVDQFIVEKCNRVSSIINAKFKDISWKLFDVQLNGGIKDCCECTYNGVAFSDLNNGMKIVSGMDIIDSLSNLYGVKCPVFVDNAESINDFNIPILNTQIILLNVTNDTTMKVEVQ